MKRIIMLTTLAATMAFMLALAGTASAIAPTTETLEPVTDDVFLIDCGDFDIRDDYVQEGTATNFYDRNGELVRIRYHFTYVDRFYNSETGKEYTATTANTIDFEDLQSGQLDAMGLEYQLTIPGVGLVVLDAGKLIYDAEENLIFESGQHQILGSNPDTEKFCEALEGS
jgi:hypothetical protein